MSKLSTGIDKVMKHGGTAYFIGKNGIKHGPRIYTSIQAGGLAKSDGIAKAAQIVAVALTVEIASRYSRNMLTQVVERIPGGLKVLEQRFGKPGELALLGGDALIQYYICEWLNSLIDEANQYYDENATFDPIFSFLESIYNTVRKQLVGDQPEEDLFNKARQVPANSDPLALDLDGDGLELTGRNNNPVLFDHDGDGIRQGTGWVSGDDGLLVFDRNHDGQINNGSELFGDQTLKYDGSGKCQNGFEALAQEDANNDGVINHLDANWNQLKVWRDLNQDGLTDEGELFTLEELGLTGLEVNPIDSASRPKGDNTITALGRAHWSDGRTGQLAAVDFYNDPARRPGFVEKSAISTG